MSLLIKSLPFISFRPTRTLSSFFLINKPTTIPTLSKNTNTNNINNTASVAAFSVSASAETTNAAVTTASSNPPPPPLNESLNWVSRTRFCGELTPDDVGKRVTLCGWVALHRVHGGLTFLNLRDHTGIVQVTTLPEDFPEAHSTANNLRLEYVVAVEGVARCRPSEAVNENMKTGFIEVAAEHVQLLNAVRSKLPFLVTTADDAKDFVKEEIRLRYRCLDLRRLQMNHNILLRHKVVKLIRRYLEDVHGFVEVD